MPWTEPAAGSVAGAVSNWQEKNGLHASASCLAPPISWPGKYMTFLFFPFFARLAFKCLGF